MNRNVYSLLLLYCDFELNCSCIVSILLYTFNYLFLIFSFYLYIISLCCCNTQISPLEINKGLSYVILMCSVPVINQYIHKINNKMYNLSMNKTFGLQQCDNTDTNNDYNQTPNNPIHLSMFEQQEVQCRNQSFKTSDDVR